MADITGTNDGETLTGTAGSDSIFGLGGNDILFGGAGTDTTDGGFGDDVHFVDDASDIVIERAGEGNDTVYVSTSYALTAGAEVEFLGTSNPGGNAAIALTGNEFAQIIMGNAGNNFLYGVGGADTLDGGAGDDVIIVDADDSVIEAVGGGNDLVASVSNYVLAAGVEVETLSTTFAGGIATIALTGNAFSQRIIGNAGANFLYGVAGVDILEGGGGDDVIIVDADDSVVEAVGGGNDLVASVSNYVLAADAEVETLSTTNGGGNASIALTGNAFGQTIIGNAGNNFLYGVAGVDTLDGGAGDDVIIVDADDSVLEAVGGGNDLVASVSNYVLAAGAEVETLSTTNAGNGASIALTGNAFGQTIIGNAGNNFLNGGGGADALQGLGGDDTYIVDADDMVTEAAGGGNDLVASSTSYALGANVEVETLSTTFAGGTGAINLTGNAFAQSILGNAGANVLDGGLGNDTLQGGGGADFFTFTTALGAGNVDTISDFNVADDTIQLGGAAGQPFVALATGSLRAGTFVIGTAALDADDYLIYNSGTGALMYDADGNGAGAAVQIATLSTGLALTVADFVVTGLANNAPTITSGGTASIAENTAASTVVYQTAATDADGDRITYSLTGTDASLLSIDASGAVRLNAPANFEAKASYTFNVVVSDSGVATTRAVTLSITDVNEGGPPTPTINETSNPNNTRLTAQSIDPGTFLISENVNLPNDDLPSATIIGSISDNSDVDFYSITLTAGQQLILDVDGTTNGLDSFLTLYGPDSNTVIGDNDDLITPDTGSNPPFPHNTDSQIIFRAATSGTYYFSVGSFENGSSGNYQLHVSVNSVPATAAQILAEDVQALISGASWNHTNLTFGFPSAASQYPQDFDEVDLTPPAPVETFEAFTSNQQIATRQLLQLIANVSDLTFTENTTQGNFNTPNTAAAADLRFAESSAAEVAYAYYPSNAGPSSEGGSAWFNHDDFNGPTRGNYAWMGILHEIGHALGLKHGHEFPLAISADHDSLEYSVMTYRSFPGGSVEGGYNNETWGYPQTLMMLDIAALQQIYDGANYGFNQGNSIYSWDATTGEMSINGVGQGAVGTGLGGTSNRILMTVWDGNGTDTYDLSNYSNAVTIDLRPGEWTTTSAAQLANLGVTGGPHFARGNIANALLYEGNTQSAIENATGGSGQDTLIANLVANNLRGNNSADTFKWMATGDAGTGGLADTVLDFQSGLDKIDFTALDAQPGTAGQQDFAFIGTGAFTNVAGQVRYTVTSGNANIFADVDGNGTADMHIILNGITTLAASDFNF